MQVQGASSVEQHEVRMITCIYKTTVHIVNGWKQLCKFPDTPSCLHRGSADGSCAQQEPRMSLVEKQTFR